MPEGGNNTTIVIILVSLAGAIVIAGYGAFFYLLKQRQVLKDYMCRCGHRHYDDDYDPENGNEHQDCILVHENIAAAHTPAIAVAATQQATGEQAQDIRVALIPPLGTKTRNTMQNNNTEIPDTNEKPECSAGKGKGKARL